MKVSGVELTRGMALGSARACTSKGLQWVVPITDM